MNPSALYHQLGVYLLAKNTNMHPGSCLCALASIYEMPEVSATNRHKIDHRVGAWLDEKTFNSTREAFQSVSSCDSEPIVSAIGGSIDTLHLIGHDIIQASAALKAIERLKAQVPQCLVDEISNKIKATGAGHPGLFYGYTSAEIRKREASFDDYNPQSTTFDVVTSLLHTLRKIKQSYIGFHFLAQETHLITHAEAIISLYQLGCHDLYRRSLKGWFLRLKLLEKVYDLKLSETHASPRKMNWDPRTLSFWDNYDSFELHIHPIKTMFSYLRLKELALFSEEDRQFLENEKLPYLADSRYLDGK